MSRADLVGWASRFRWCGEIGSEIDHFFACPEGLKWLSGLPAVATPAEAWAECSVPEWLTWAARHAGVTDDEIRGAIWPAVERVICKVLPAELAARGVDPLVCAFFEGLSRAALAEASALELLRGIARGITGREGADLIFHASAVLQGFEEGPDTVLGLARWLGGECTSAAPSGWLREERVRELGEVRAVLGWAPEWLETRALDVRRVKGKEVAR